MAISDLKLPEGVNAHTFKNPATMAEGLAISVAAQLNQAIASQGVATLVVSGGRSPVAFFESLVKQPVDWSKVVVSLADERWVPVEHADSNAGLLKKHLLQGPAAKARFVGLYNAAATVERAALEADQGLAELPPIDVLILGMGDDGHTASLFPKHKVLSIQGQSKLNTLNEALGGTEVAALPIRAFLQPTLEIYWCP